MQTSRSAHVPPLMLIAAAIVLLFLLSPRLALAQGCTSTSCAGVLRCTDPAFSGQCLPSCNACPPDDCGPCPPTSAMNAQPSVSRRGGRVAIAWTADDDASLVTNDDRHIVTALRDSGGNWRTTLATGLPDGADTPSLALWSGGAAGLAFLVRGTDGDGVTPTAVISDQAHVRTATADSVNGVWSSSPVVEENGQEARGEHPILAVNPAAPSFAPEALLVYRRFGDHTSQDPATDTFGHIVMTQVAPATSSVPPPVALTSGPRQRWLQTVAIDPTTGEATVLGVDVPNSTTPSAEDDTLVTRVVDPGPDLTLENLVGTPAHADPGSPVTAKVTIRNVGRARATGSITADFHAGSPGSGTLLATVALPMTGLDFNQSYDVEVVLTASGGRQPIWAEVRFSGSDIDPSNNILAGDLRRLSAPMHVMASPAADADRALDLSWLAPPEGGTIAYRVVRPSAGGEAALAGESEVNHFRDRFLGGGETYCYTVVAYDETGLFSAPSAPACGTVASMSPLGVALAGDKLSLKDDPDDPAKRKASVTSKDPSFTTGAEGGPSDPVLHGATLRIGSAAGNSFDGAYDLPASNWTYIGRPGSGAGYRYRAPRPAPEEPAPAIQIIVLQPGKLVKIKGKGAALSLDLTQEPDPVDIRLRVGEQLICMRFAGRTKFAGGRRFVARDAPAPRTCPISPAED